MNHRNQSVSWVHPAIEVRDAGDKGIGSFATARIQKGEIVIVQGGRIIDSAALDTPEYEPYAYHCYQIEKDFYIAPLELSREFIDGVFNMNHSCEPTCGIKGQLTMVALRDIQPGDEITFDYAMSDVGTAEEGWEPMTCKCGTASCRGSITGYDWSKPELQERYKGYFSRYVQDIIDTA